MVLILIILGWLLIGFIFAKKTADLLNPSYKEDEELTNMANSMLIGYSFLGIFMIFVYLLFKHDEKEL